MSTQPELMTQAAFARAVNRSKGLISQWKKDGKLDASCFRQDERGRDLVIVAVALERLGKTLDPIQSVANGKPLGPAAPQFALPRGGQIEPGQGATATDQLTQARVRNLELTNLEREERRRAAAGVYCRTAEVAGVFSQTLDLFVSGVDASLLRLAETMAAEHKSEVKAELTTLRAWFREVRETAAKGQGVMLERLPRLVDDPIEGETDGNPSAIGGASGSRDGAALPDADPAAES